jgi:hypothetical protein
MDDNVVEFSDPFELSFLILRDPDIESCLSYIVRANFTYAQVPDTAQVQGLLTEYNSGCQVDARSYARTVKRIRGSMINRRDMTRGLYDRNFHSR